MISLHATKVFGVGEGGLVLSTDWEFIRRFNQVCNFGVWDSPAGQILGYNGKLSEYNAAVGLAMLGKWEERRTRLVRLTEDYAERLDAIAGVGVLPGYGNGWVSCYCNVRTDRAAAPVIERLTELGVETRRWWQSGVHVQKAYEHFPQDALENTERLASRVFGLPFFHDLSEAQVERVVKSLEIALA